MLIIPTLFRRVSLNSHWNLSRMSLPFRSSRTSVFVVLYFLLASVAVQADMKGGEALYQSRCAVCHDNPQGHTPPKVALGTQAPEAVVNTLTSGVMRAQGVRLSTREKADVAHYLTGREVGSGPAFAWQENQCSSEKIQLRIDDTQWNGWGRDPINSRYQPNAGFGVKDIPTLKPKWTFAYPGGRRNAQPTIVGNVIYAGLFPGELFALHAETGCTLWNLDVGSGVRNSVTVAAIPDEDSSGRSSDHSPTRYAAYFGTNENLVYGVDAKTGEVFWKTKIDDNLVGRITGSGILHEGVFYVPMSSNEEVAATSTDYGCCTFRGSVTAIDVSDGSVLWKTHVIDEAPQPTKINSDGNQMYGPAGAAIWSSPTVDAKRGLLYVATGDSYTDVKEDGSDAIVALELKTGNVRWKNQVTPNDNFVIGCGRSPSHGNCPEELGPDYDFGSSPVLFTLADGRDVLLAGQKSAEFYLMDPDTGKTLWETRLGRGGALGGIQWGFASDGKNAYVAVSDIGGRDRDTAKPGITAIDIATRKMRWHTPAPAADCPENIGFRCTNAHSQAVTAMPGAIFAGAGDGHFRAFSSEDGSVLWDYDSAAQEYQTVNGLTVKGGYFDGGGAVIANGMLVVNSGFNVREGQPGNVLVVMTPGGE